MSFLNPIAGLIAAGIAIPLVILLYFLRLRRRPVRVSSTLLWDRAVKDLEVNVPFRWLRLSLPLVLQALGIALLALAIGRPVVDGIPGGGSGARAMIVIDRSASMSARIPSENGTLTDTTRLDLAKRDALALVSALARSGSEISIVQLGAIASVVAPPSTNPGLAREAIDSITPSDQPGNLESLFELLRGFGAPDDQRPIAEDGELTTDAAAMPEVHVFSDARNPPLRGSPRVILPGLFLQHHAIGVPGGSDAQTVTGSATTPSGPAGPSNLGIVAISARRDYDDPVTVRLLVRVLASGFSSPGSAAAVSAEPVASPTSVRIMLDGEDLGAATLRFDNQTPGPPEATGTFAFPCPRGGVLTASLPGGDALASDDSVALVLRAPLLPRVVVVGPGAPGTAATDAGVDPLIRSCLKAMEFSRLDFLDPSQAAARLAAPPEALPDLVIFDRVRPTALPPVPTISFGASLPIEGLSVTPVRSPSGTNATRIVAWRRAHPLLKDVPLDGVVVDPATTITFVSPAAGATGPRAQSTPSYVPLAEGFDGTLIGLLTSAGVPHVVVGFPLASSNWGPTASFPVFLAGAIDTLTLRAESAAGRAFRTGEPLVVRLAQSQPTAAAGGSGAPSATLPRRVEARRIGNGSTAILFADLEGPSARGVPTEITLGIPEFAGVYRLSGAADAVAAVNLCEADESLLSPAAGATRAGFPISGEVRSQTPARPDAAGKGEAWPHALFAAIVLLTLEWFIVAWRMRV